MCLFMHFQTLMVHEQAFAKLTCQGGKSAFSFRCVAAGIHPKVAGKWHWSEGLEFQTPAREMIIKLSMYQQ